MYESFIEKTIEAVENTLGKNYCVKMQTIRKNNNIILKGLTIFSKNSSLNASPTIYLDDYYKQYSEGRDLKDIVKDIIYIFHENEHIDFDISSFTDFEKVKHRICYKLVNTALNRELLNDMPNRSLRDLSIIYYVLLNDFKDSTASTTIHNNHLNFWNITENDLYELASKNTATLLPVSIKGIFDTLTELADSTELPLPESDDFMYVISNQKKLSGAATILYPDVLENFSAAKQANLWLIPSSIHEWLIIPDDGNITQSSLNEMIQEVNSTQVVPNEILSDHAYYYSRETSVITI